MAEELIIEKNTIISCTSRQEEVAVPDGVICIGAGAFKGCASIKRILLPDSVEVIEPHAFKGCRKLEYIRIPQNLRIIGEYAFHRCHHLKEIQLPYSVKRLENCAFLYCDSLRRAELPGVTELGKQAFLNDVNLEELVIAENLNSDSICECFTGCNKITKIVLKSDDAKNSEKSYALKNIVDILSGKEQVFPVIRTIVRDIYAILKIEDGVLVEYLNNVKHVELPEGITAIGRSCFFDKRGIHSVVFPKSLKKIGARAFRGCMGLEQVEFLQEDVEIEESAFENCSSLYEIILPNEKRYKLLGLKELSGSDVSELVKKIHAQVLENFVISGTMLIKYRGCETKVVVPEGITIIGQRAFAGNEAIDRIELPNTVTYIEREAFADCVVLQSIAVSENLCMIEDAAFENCVKLIRIYLPKTVRVIPASCFKRCSSLQEVHFVNLESKEGILLKDNTAKGLIIENLAFYGCKKLRIFDLPETVEKTKINEANPVEVLEQTETIHEIESKEAKDINVLEQTKIIGTIQKIGDMAFYGCSSLKELKLPPALKNIGRLAFKRSGMEPAEQEDLHLKNVFCQPVSFEFIKNETGEVEIAEGVETIEDYAFFGDETITKVRFPDSLKKIGFCAFYGCTNLKKVNFPKKKVILQEGCFEKCICLEVLVCNTEYMPKRAFAWCRNLKEFQVDGLREIDKEAFQGCMNLKQIDLKETSYIGKNAFAMCDGLEAVTVSEKAVFDDFCFLDCGSLKTIIFQNIIHESEKPEEDLLPYYMDYFSIKSGAFRGCTSLKTIVIEKQHVVSGAQKSQQEMAASTQYNLLGYDTLFDESVPQFIKRIYANALSVFAIDKNILTAYDGFASKVTIPNGIKGIGREVFRDKENLKELIIPDSVEEIGARAFDKTQWLRDKIEESLSRQNLSEKNEPQETGLVVWKGILIDGTACKGRVVLPSSIKRIAGWAFANNMALKELQFEAEPILEEFAFRNCIYLEKIILKDKTQYTLGALCDMERPQPPAVTQIIKECYNCFKMEGNLLAECTGNIECLKLPKGICRIGKNAFKDSNLLTCILLNGEVTEIEEGAFMQCKWLRTVENAGSLMRIGKKAFSGCIRLEKINGLQKLEYVGEKAFENCISLEIRNGS